MPRRVTSARLTTSFALPGKTCLALGLLIILRQYGNYLVSKGGRSSVSFSIARKPLEWCVNNIGLRPDNWRTDLATKNLTIAQNSRTGFGETYPVFGYIIVEIDKDDLATSRLSKEWKQGFHLLESDEIEAREF